MPAVNEISHARENFFVNSEGKVFDGADARPEKKLLVTFPAPAFPLQTTHIRKISMHTRTPKKNRLLALIAASTVLALQANTGFAADPTNQVTIESKDTTHMGWEILDIPQIKAKLPVKFLESDKETGVTVIMVKYAAGFINTWHTHPTAHGMYVLDGVLVTHQGEFGPGSWVWFPEGGWMQHGATAKNDVTVLFITNKKFDIKYRTDKDPWYPADK
jgi:quercetin dioxygenase-like cupin family protein